ncbi:MAG: hypothetical protein V2A54_02540, partial [Bacteroidota bacterium]
KYSGGRSSYKYSKKHKRVEGKKFLGLFRRHRIEKGGDSYGSRWSGNRSSYSYNKKHKRVEGKRFLGVFQMHRREKSGDSFGSRYSGGKSSYKYNKRKKRVMGRKFLFFRLNKREGGNDSFRVSFRPSGSSYAYNKNKRRVLPKKFLWIFRLNKREKETSSFRGGKFKHALKFNVFNERKKHVVHRKWPFNRKHEKEYKSKKKPEMDLFPRKVRHYQIGSLYLGRDYPINIRYTSSIFFT